MNTLRDKLVAATLDHADKKVAYGVAALAAQENSSQKRSASEQPQQAQLKEATRVLQEAEARVTELTAAVMAEEEREKATQQAEQDAADEAHRAAVFNVLAELQRAGQTWDAALDALSNATEGLLQADARLRLVHAPADIYLRMEQARAQTLTLLNYRLRGWTGTSQLHPAFRQERLQPLLPQG